MHITQSHQADQMVLSRCDIPEAVHWITAEKIRPFFHPRVLDSHKGSYGHLLCIGGSKNKPGAILLSGRAALRSGCGLVTVALPDKAFRKLSKGFLELMYEPLPSTADGGFSKKGWKKLEKIFEGKSAIAIGPGMGVNEGSKFLLLALLKKGLATVIDADALNTIALLGTNILRGHQHTILTPHPGEMARLTGKSTTWIQKNRIKAARDFAKTHRVYLVLKGHRTVIANPQGEVFVNSTGNPGMATAGMGDVLTGVIASLAAQGMELEKAVLSGVFLHGRAGDRVSEKIGDRGLLATDVIDEIPMAIKDILGLYS